MRAVPGAGRPGDANLWSQGGEQQRQPAVAQQRAVRVQVAGDVAVDPLGGPAVGGQVVAIIGDVYALHAQTVEPLEDRLDLTIAREALTEQNELVVHPGVVTTIGVKEPLERFERRFVANQVDNAWQMSA
jgi:hypothetical protein